MIYFTPVVSPTIAVSKRFGRSLLAVPVFMLLVGCDSASSTTANNSTSIHAAPLNSAADNDLQNAANTAPDSDAEQANANSEMDKAAEGSSPLGAGNLDASTRKQRSPMISELNDDSALQATLMGDYGGMVPCASCDNIDITLNLFADGSVLKTSIYNNAAPPQAHLLESGIYRQDQETITIVYENKNIETYMIQNNHLLLMDKDKKPNDDYTLSRK